MLLSTFNKELYEQELKDNAYNAGHADGCSEGVTRKLKDQVRKKLTKGKAPEVIAEELYEKGVSAHAETPFSCCLQFF